VFFKHYIVRGDHEEDNPESLKRLLRGKMKLSHVTREMKDEMIVKRVLRTHQKGLLPNIALTGIKEVDKPPKRGKDEETKCFTNYIKERGCKNIPEILDLDQYFSTAHGDPNPLLNPVASLLPTLLNSFMIITDKELEKRCIGVIMRLFNQ
jgi:inositol 1,4,5-triphosphate receptor type 1/inositol 1,4,5-triphosphate receptor type 3